MHAMECPASTVVARRVPAFRLVCHKLARLQQKTKEEEEEEEEMLLNGYSRVCIKPGSLISIRQRQCIVR